MQNTERRLAAILVADVVGYSRAMGADEDGTLARLSSLRKAVIAPLIDRHNGRIVKLMGDGILAEFPSVVNAVACAMAWQEATTDSQLEFRIGVNLGDVIVEDNDIYGHGVNVASRLEGLATPGGICISASVHNEIKARLDVTFEDLGLQTVKNIDEPIRAYRIGSGVKSHRPAKRPPPVQKGFGESVVVLPFDNMSGDDEQRYFSDGITEDLITDLSKIPALFVIARNTSFSYREKSLDVRRICRELNVSHALEGSVRRAGSRIRITAQLIDGQTGGHVWAERYDRELQDIFALQDEITRQIVSALCLALKLPMKDTTQPSRPVNPEAFDYALRARQLTFEFNRQACDEATRLFGLALEIDPEFGMAYSGLSVNLHVARSSGWAGPDAWERALAASDAAVRLNPSDPQARRAHALSLLWCNKLDEASTEINRAVSLAPNLAEAQATRGHIMTYRGKHAEAIEALEMAMRLEPHYWDIWLHFLAVARYLNREFKIAAELLERRIRRSPQTDISRALLISCYGQMEKCTEARHIWQELKTINPDYSLEGKINTLPYERQEDRDLLLEGIGKAGISSAD